MNVFTPRPPRPIALAYRAGVDGSANLYPARGHLYAAWLLGLAAGERQATKAAMDKLTGEENKHAA